MTLALIFANFGCRPDFDQDDALVTSARVLAVKSEPAEAKPGAIVAFTGLVAMPQSSSDQASLVWSFCTAPKPPTVDNVVSPACLAASSLLRAGEGITIAAPTPSDACTLFGPNVAANGFRPRDPDVTGGYFQPLRVDLSGAEPAFHLQRVSCGLGEASAEVASEFGREYVANENPRLTSLNARIAGQDADLGRIPAGATVEFAVTWGAADAENYAYFERATQTIITRREAMRVAWYVSAGRLGTEATGRAEGDPELGSANVWTAPDTADHAKLWVVLRDSRGGIDFATRDIEVVP